MKLSILLSYIFTILVAEEAKPNFTSSPSADYAFGTGSAILRLKGQTIPSDGTGVVIFSDVGGYLGHEDGLLCTSTNSGFHYRSWSYPNGTVIEQLPRINVFGIYVNVCDVEHSLVSLYYSGQPKERGQFQCHLYYAPVVPGTSVYIVDMNVTGPTLDWPGEIAIAGEDVELSIYVTTSPTKVSLPYQWMLNGTNLIASHKYHGIQNSTLTIFSVQDEDQGNYTCAVAHSASGTRGRNITLRVLTIGVTVSSSTNSPRTGKNYTLSCSLSGIDLLKDANPDYQYIWFKDGLFFYDSGTISSYIFKSLTFSDAGNYKCHGNVSFNRRSTLATANGISPPLSLVFPDIVYRIYLNIKVECHLWTTQEESTMTKKRNDINTHIVRGIQKMCNHVQVTNDILKDNDAFKCPNSPKDVVVYNARLYHTDETNTSILVSCLEKWIQTRKIIPINEVELEINHNCTGVVNDNNNDYECAASPTVKPKSEVNRLAIGLGVGFGSLSTVLGFILFFALLYIIRNRRRNGYNDMRG